MGSDDIKVQKHGEGLLITAEEKEFYVPQNPDAKSPMRDVTRKLHLELSTENLKVILDAALRANLLHATFEISKNEEA